jgi:hypothetical protein
MVRVGAQAPKKNRGQVGAQRRKKYSGRVGAQRRKKYWGQRVAPKKILGSARLRAQKIKKVGTRAGKKTAVGALCAKKIL